MRKRVRAARGYGRPREWVLTAALAGAARGPGTRRREIESRECENIEHADSTLAYHVAASNPHTHKRGRGTSKERGSRVTRVRVLYVVALATFDLATARAGASHGVGKRRR